MKRIMSTMILASLAMLAEFASGAEQLKFDNDNGFESVQYTWGAHTGYNAKFPGGAMKRIEGGRSGYCLEVTNTDKSRFIFWNGRSVPIGLNNDVIKPSVWVKGKGTFKFALYFYGTDDKYVNSYGGQSNQVDTAEWQRVETPFQFKPEDAWINDAVSFRIVFEVLENSSLKFDDFDLNIDGGSKVTMTTPNAPAVVQVTNAPAPVTAFKTGIVETLLLKDVKAVKLTVQVNEQPVPPPEGAAATVTTNGIELKYVFPGPGQDACMVEFAADIPEFNQLEITIDGDASGHRAFIVLIDAGGESHYFALDNDPSFRNNLQYQAADYGAVKWRGKQKIKMPIAVKNPFEADLFASRWGGDRNQRIDFPVKKIMLGMNDYPDTATGSGQVTFETIEFLRK